MNRKAYQTLEFYKITERLAGHAASAGGRKRCMELEPMQNIDDINRAQSETADALSRIYRRGGLYLAGAKDVRPSLKRLEVGSSLNILELLDICTLLETAGKAKQYGRQNEEREEQPDTLDPLFSALEPCTPLTQEIRRCILSEEEISDDASPALRSVRRSIRTANDRIHSTLSGMVNGSARTYLQDAVITQRNGRYCIPVKAEYRSQVPGMIHDQSSTGSTLFVEPMAVVRLNNDLKELYLKEQEEIEHVLETLSSQAASCTEALAQDYGPNTGGKTVSLKTTGLLTLMGQAGLHIPAARNSQLAVFDEVYADIGDEQSIEQSLSTFSSHMTNIVRILKEASLNSLVLFDELCAGTDPTEGAALAIAILSHLHKMGIRTMATTHYSELKVFALSTAGVENACCEFDVETLSPTYRLLIGIPGKSNAFAISSKLGLPGYLIEDARSHLSEQNESFEDLLADLEHSRRTIEQEQEEIREHKEEIRSLKEALEKKQEKLDTQRDRILREANEQARKILQEAKDYADHEGFP